MGLHYPDQSLYDVLGTIAAPVTLSAVYTVNNHIVQTENMAQTLIQFGYHADKAANVLDILIESSPDKSDAGNAFGTVAPKFSQDLTNATTAGVVTLSDQEFHYTAVADNTTYERSFPYPVQSRQIRISAKENKAGGGNFGTLWMRILVSGL